MLRIARGGPRRPVAVLMSLLLVASLFATMSVSPALAQTISTDPMVQLLTHYNLVRGDSRGLRLQDPLTRAELAVLVVRALGKESDAQLLQGLQVFKDVPGTHWASGEIAVVKRLGIVQGYPDGTFGDKRNVTYAEMLTIYLRLVDQEPATGTWPTNVLIKALELNINPPGVVLGQVANTPALRLHVFQAMGATMTTVPVTADGKTLLQANVDSTAPQVALSALPQVTPQNQVTVQATVGDAVRATVNGATVPVVSGGFSTTVQLQPGVNEIQVEAFDMAGNKGTATASVTRAVEIARIEVTGPNEVNAGATANYTVKAVDRSGVNLGGVGVTARTEGNIGNFVLNAAGQGVLTAGTAGVSGRIVLTAGSVTQAYNVTVLGPAPSAVRLQVVPQTLAELNKDSVVQVEVVDAAGNRVTTDNNRTVTLGYSGLAGVTVTPVSATTRSGVAAFSLKGTVAGTVTLRPLATGLATSDFDLLVASPVRVKLVTSTTQLNPDGVSQATITADLVDAAGNEVANQSNADIVVRVSQSGTDGRLLGNELVIRRSARGSSSFISYEAGTQNNATATLSGQVTSGQAYLVTPVSIRLHQATLAEARALRVFSITRTTLDTSDSATLAVEVVDANGNVITDGSVAFQLKVTTSNNEEKTDGIPDGMQVNFYSASGLSPVSDGISESASNDGPDVIGRTFGGRALVELTYNKSGVVTVEPVAVGATSSAYTDDGDRGSASSSTGLELKEQEIRFRAPAVGLKLVVDSALGTEQTVGGVRNSTGANFTVRAYVVDAFGGAVPGATNSITISATGDNVTSWSGNVIRNAVDGKRDFSFSAKATTGVAYFTATASGLDSSNEVPVYVQSGSPGTPAIITIFGAGANGAVNQENTIGADDTHMRIELESMATGAGVVKVFRSGSSTAIYTTGAVDLSSAPHVLVPKSALPKGTYQYQVTVRNAVSESSKSALSEPVVNASLLSSPTISSATYDAATNKLTISGSGFTSISASRGYDLTQMHLISPGGETLNLDGADTVTYSSSSTLTIAVSDFQANLLENPNAWYGNVTLNADTGWYFSGSDQTKADKDNKVTGFARITAAYYYVYSSSSRRLIVKGDGLACSTTLSSCMDLSKLKLSDGVDPDIVLTGASMSRSSDSEWTITLTNSQADALEAMDASSQLVAQEGWFKAGSAKTAPFDSVTLQAKFRLGTITYNKTSGVLTITGNNLGSANLDVSKLSLREASPSRTTALVLDGAVTYESSTQVSFTVTDAVKTTLSAYSGTDIYLVADDGWFEDAQGREAVGIGSQERPVSLQ